MSQYYCNPLNLPYKYNFQKPNMPGLGEAKLSVYREAADPTLEYFKGRSPVPLPLPMWWRPCASRCC